MGGWLSSLFGGTEAGRDPDLPELTRVEKARDEYLKLSADELSRLPKQLITRKNATYDMAHSVIADDGSVRYLGNLDIVTPSIEETAKNLKVLKKTIGNGRAYKAMGGPIGGNLAVVQRLRAEEKQKELKLAKQAEAQRQKAKAVNKEVVTRGPTRSIPIRFGHSSPWARGASQAMRNTVKRQQAAVARGKQLRQANAASRRLSALAARSKLAHRT